MTVDQRWNCAGGLILFAVALFSAAQWPVYPYFLDSYYHLSVIQGFADAGGPIGHAFWEAAPQGRPHLYPPLFHLLFLPGRLLGAAPIPLARFWTWLSFPLLLWIVWVVLRRVSTPRRAALTLLLLSTPYSFFLGSINFVPATLVLIAAAGIALALDRGRFLAAGLFLAAAFWTHAGLPWLVALAVFLFGFFSPPHRKNAWKALAVGLAAASPWLIVQVRHLSLFHLQPRGEERFLETPFLAVALGLWGIRLAWKERGLSRFWIALAVGFLPMLAGYRARFLATQGLFPLLLLGGIALDSFGEKIRNRWVGVGLLALLVLGSPSVHFSEKNRPAVVWGDTTLGILSGLSPGAPRGTNQPLYQAKWMDDLAGAVKAQTLPNDLIYCNISYIGGMLSVLTGRATTNQMLREMADRPLAEQIRPARVVAWIKDPSGTVHPTAEEAAFRFHLRPIGETELAFLYYNPNAQGQRRVVGAVVPWWLVFGIMGLAGGIAFLDLKRRS